MISPTLLFSELPCKFFHSIRVHPDTLQHLFISRFYITCTPLFKWTSILSWSLSPPKDPFKEKHPLYRGSKPLKTPQKVRLKSFLEYQPTLWAFNLEGGKLKNISIESLGFLPVQGNERGNKSLNISTLRVRVSHTPGFKFESQSSSTSVPPLT